MKWLMSLLLFCGANSFLYSQNPESISGRISDKQFNVALAGAKVLLQELNKPLITHYEGYFIFSNLKESKVTLIISYVGHETIELNVGINAGKATTVDYALNPHPHHGAGYEIVISASRHPYRLSLKKTWQSLPES